MGSLNNNLNNNNHLIIIPSDTTSMILTCRTHVLPPNSYWRGKRLQVNLRDFPAQWHKTCIEIISLNSHVAPHTNDQASYLLRLPLCLPKQQQKTVLKLPKNHTLFRLSAQRTEASWIIFFFYSFLPWQFNCFK